MQARLFLFIYEMVEFVRENLNTLLDIKKNKP